MLEIQSRKFSAGSRFDWSESYLLNSSPAELLCLREKCIGFAKWLMGERGECSLDAFANSDAWNWMRGDYDATLPPDLIPNEVDREVVRDIGVVVPTGFIWFASAPIRYRDGDDDTWIYCDGVDERGLVSKVSSHAKRKK